MLSLLCALALVPVRYDFNPSTRLVYDVQVVFDGFIPILGGQEGVVSVTMGVAVEGLVKDSEGRAQAASEIKEFKLVFNDAALPLGLDNVTNFFPRTTVSLSPEGKVLKTNAPDVQLPVRLPGLHVKRFPDITYLPLEFPTEGVEVGKSWTYSKSFGDADVVYTVTATKIEGDTLSMDVSLAQEYTVLEDEAKNVVEAKDAVATVVTKLTGKGTAEFDLRKGAVRRLQIDADAASTVVDLQTKEKSQRQLKTTLKVRLRDKS